jgi:very-short-patch-repair endonuclease
VVDFHWPGLVVEIDGSGHARPRTRAEDRERDEALRERGYEIVRLTADRLESARPSVIARLARGSSAR